MTIEEIIRARIDSPRLTDSIDNSVPSTVRDSPEWREQQWPAAAGLPHREPPLPGVLESADPPGRETRSTKVYQKLEVPQAPNASVPVTSSHSDAHAWWPVGLWGEKTALSV